MSLTAHTDLASKATAVDPLFPAILLGKLSDDESLSSLIERKERFLADPALTINQRVRGQRLFNRAINTEFPAASQNGTPGVAVLKRVLIGVGRIIREPDREESDEQQVTYDLGETRGEGSNGEGPSGTTTNKPTGSYPNGEDGDEDGGKNGATGSGEDGGKNNEDGNSDTSSDAFDPAPHPTKPGSRKHKQQRDAEGMRYPKRAKTDSGPNIHDLQAWGGRDLNDDDDALPTSAQIHPTGTTHPLINYKTVHVSLTTGKVRKERSGFTRPSLLLKLPFDSSKLMGKYLDLKHNVVKKKKNKGKDKARVESEIEDAQYGQHDQDTSKGKRKANVQEQNDQDGRETPTLPSSAGLPISNARDIIRARTQMYESESTVPDSITHSQATDPMLAPSIPHTFAFPPFPPLPERELDFFTRGISHAIENIAEGHAEQPLLTLLELVEDLESERPEVSDWQRLAIMKGAEYVYEAVRAVCEGSEDGESEAGLDGVGHGGLEGEAIARLVEQITEHVELEQAQVERRLGL